MLFIFTTSFDTTADLLVYHMGTAGVFRFNFDLWRDYAIAGDAQGFRFEDPVGRVVDSQSVTKLFWRKPARTKDRRRIVLHSSRPLGEPFAYKAQGASRPAFECETFMDLAHVGPVDPDAGASGDRERQ